MGQEEPEQEPVPVEARDGEPDAPPSEPETNAVSTLLALLILAALIAGIVWLVAELAPGEVHEKANPGFLDNVFANPVVIAAARIVLIAAAAVMLFGGLYIVVSVLVRMQRGHWLRRAGPFESEVAEVEEGLEQANMVYEWWTQALQENEQLSEWLEQRDQTIQELLVEREALVEELEKRAET